MNLQNPGGIQDPKGDRSCKFIKIPALATKLVDTGLETCAIYRLSHKVWFWEPDHKKSNIIKQLGKGMCKHKLMK